MTKPAPSTAPDRSGADVPAPRAGSATTPTAHAAAGLAVVRRLGSRLDAVVGTLDERTARAGSELPGWTRQHVLSHLARNADALVNLLGWAQTGVEHPMYPSRADRDADIEEGAGRMLVVVQEDLTAATERFLSAAADLPDTAWENTVVGSRALPTPAAQIPWMRAVELLVHSADLGLDLDFDSACETVGDGLGGVFDQVTAMWRDRDDTPALRVEITEPAAERRVLLLGPATDRTEVAAPAGTVLGWLTGRLHTPDLPTLPAWL
jgi:maleylpyruvate isomerase